MTVDNYALLNAVMNGYSDKVMLFIQDFVLEKKENYKRSGENFIGTIGPEGYGKYVSEIDENFGCLLILTKNF